MNDVVLTKENSMLEKAFDIKLNLNCKEINRTIYYLLNGNKQNKI